NPAGCSSITLRTAPRPSCHFPLQLTRRLRPFSRRAGRAFAWGTSQGLCRALHAACERAALAYLSPHKIGRHAFAARLLRAGYDIKTVKEAGRVDEYGHLEQRAAHKAMLDVAENPRIHNADLSIDYGETFDEEQKNGPHGSLPAAQV